MIAGHWVTEIEVATSAMESIVANAGEELDKAVSGGLLAPVRTDNFAPPMMEGILVVEASPGQTIQTFAQLLLRQGVAMQEIKAR